MQNFKKIVRHIAKHDMNSEIGGKFEADNRQNLRRLAKLGVVGHTP